MHDVIIIGGGAAGLTAGLYAGRSGLKALLLEKKCIGGQIITTWELENYPGFVEPVSPSELLINMEKQAKKFGLEIGQGDVIGIKHQSDKTISVECKKRTHRARAVIIATGQNPSKLGVPGEERFTGKGVSYCATCDGPLYKGKDVAVVGGGNAAIEEALFLTKFARKIYAVHRRDKLRAVQVIQERAFANEKIEFVLESVVTEILGDQKVTGLRTRNVKTKQESDLKIDGTFIFIGSVPNTEFLKGVLDLDEKGYIVTKDDMSTSSDGIFACGDCRQKPLRQVITACGDGATAAASARHYIEGLK